MRKARRTTMSKKGIDISHFQGTPDFSKLKGKVDFVIVQIGYGRYTSQVDKTFERNYRECKKYGIPIGGYWFSYATTAADAKLEAKACLEVIKGKSFEYPIWYDVEGKSLTGRTAVSEMCKAFCGALEQAGYFTGIYMSRSPAQTMLTAEISKRYALWLAEYGAKLNYTGTVGMWQYTSGGSVPGISGAVDMDECYVDYPAIIKAKRLNGFKAQAAPTPTPKVLDEAGFKRGQQSDGILAVKCMLMLAKLKGAVTAGVDPNGIFGKGTEAAANELLKKWGYKENGIIGPNFILRLKDILK
jgi:GH25 family lysozyme M1 (1,4-beta-N-acetylmuramidase)